MGLEWISRYTSTSSPSIQSSKGGKRGGRTSIDGYNQSITDVLLISWIIRIMMKRSIGISGSPFHLDPIWQIREPEQLDTTYVLLANFSDHSFGSGDHRVHDVWGTEPYAIQIAADDGSSGPWEKMLCAQYACLGISMQENVHDHPIVRTGYLDYDVAVLMLMLMMISELLQRTDWLTLGNDDTLRRSVPRLSPSPFKQVEKNEGGRSKYSSSEVNACDSCNHSWGL